MKFVFTRFKTFAAAYASPVSITTSPVSVEVAEFAPVPARTKTLLVTVAVFEFKTFNAELLRHVRMVQPNCVGLSPAPSSKKYERSKSRRSKVSPVAGSKKRIRPSELKRFVLTTFKT